MTSGKQPMQAMDTSGDGAGESDGVGEVASRRDAPSQVGESGGGAYPNPHTGKDGQGGTGGFMGHGGQSEINYSGPQQLGDHDKEEQPNVGTRGE